MKKIYFILIILLNINTTNAQWQKTNGPGGGTIYCIAVSGDNIFAGTNGGVYLSSDNGSSWKNVNNGLTNFYVKSIAISGNSIFAGTLGGGVFLSTNNGSSWKAVNNGLPNYNHVFSLVASGNNIFAGYWGAGVFLSTNNGGNWVKVNNGLTHLDVKTLATSGNNIFAGTASGGVFLSTNNGTSWAAMNTGLSGSALYVQAFGISGSNIYLGGGNGVFLSTNNGKSWTEVSTGLSGYGKIINSFVVSDNNVFIGTNQGVYRSSNNGGSWVSVNTGFIYPNTLVYAMAISGRNIFAGTEDTGMFLSTNNGNSWDVVKTGLSESQVAALAISGNNIFASNFHNGIFLSNNNGNSWAAVNTGLWNLDVQALAISGNNIFAGAGCGGVFLSTDNGSTWANVNIGLTYRCIYSLAVSGSNIFVGTQGGVFLSTNNGSNWISKSNGLPAETWQMTLSISGSNIFAGTKEGVYLSSNNGSSWNAINKGLTNLDVKALAINGNNIFVGTHAGGVFLSSNNGGNWVEVNNGLTNLNVSSFAISGSNIFVGTNGGGVFLSTNNGTSWTPINSGLTKSFVFSLVIDQGYVFAGTDGGVWKLPLPEEPKIAISGRVSDQAGNPIIGAVMKGLPENPMTDNKGNFQDSVSKGWSGNVIPSLKGYDFSPVSISYSNIIENKINQDFKGNLFSKRYIQVKPTAITINQNAVSSINNTGNTFPENERNTLIKSAIKESPKLTNHSMGCHIPDPIIEYWKNHEPTPILYLKSLKTNIDWSINDSPVKDQGVCGACWAFASIALIENLGSRTNLSEQSLISCSESGNCQSGFYEQAMQFIQRKGVPDETCYPYIQENGICSDMCLDPSFNEKILTVSKTLWGMASIDNLKLQLQNGPLVVTMKVPIDNTFDGDPGYQGGIYHYSGGLIPENRVHAILLVGYDDTQKCFKAKNSWGSWWGENGYFRISYEDVTNEVQFGSYAINGSGVYSEYLSNSSFTISNQGNDDLTIKSILSNKDWLTISGFPGNSFLLSSSTSLNVSVAVNWSKTTSSIQIDTITIESNDPDKPFVTVQVTAIPLPCSSITKPTITQSGNTTFCEGSYVILNASAGNNLVFQWKKNGNPITNANGSSYIATSGGGYNVEVTNVVDGCSTESSTVAVVVNPTPPAPKITLNGSTLLSNQATDNQWYNESGLIAGATNQSYSSDKSGHFYAVVSIAGCNSEPSNTINFVYTAIDANVFNNSIKIYPNPVSNKLMVEIEGNKEMVKFEILNSIGQVVFNGNLMEKTFIPTSGLSSGIYLIRFKNGKTPEYRKFIKD